MTTAAERAAQRDRTDFAPVFLLAPVRSFSTVSLALLAGHPDLYGFPEMLLFTATDVGGLLAERVRRPNVPPWWIRNRLTGVLRAVADLNEGSQSPEAVLRARHWLADRADWTTVRLMDYLLDRAWPCTGLEKSPDSTQSDRALDACTGAYPNARFIHLTRHPVTTQRSMHEHFGPLWPDDPRVVAVRSASAWYLSHLRIAKRLAAMPPERSMRVRAEDLLREPAVWLSRICAWLGLRCDEQIIDRMRRTERWRFAGRGEGGKLGGGDRKFLCSPALRPVPEPGPVRFDPAWGLHPELTSRMTRLAAYLGY